MFIINNPYVTHPENVAPPVGTDATFQFLFNNNTNEETGNHTPSATGTFSYITGPNANNPNAVALDGSQYIDLPASANFSVTSFTIAFYMRRAGFPSGFDAILEHDRFGNNWYGVFNASTGGEINFRTADTSGPDALATNVSWNTGQWYHLIFTYNGTTATIYRDGVNIASGATDTGTANLSAIRLFRNLDNGEGLVADIARFEFWNVGKNSTEIGTIYSNAQ